MASIVRPPSQLGLPEHGCCNEQPFSAPRAVPAPPERPERCSLPVLMRLVEAVDQALADATEANEQLGQIASQMLRGGGGGTTFNLFLNSAQADDLLFQLGAQDKLAQHSEAVPESLNCGVGVGEPYSPLLLVSQVSRSDFL